MSGLFSSPKIPPMPPPPKPVRMPTENQKEAGLLQRRRLAARKGRRSTILSSSLKDTTGSSGQSLGA
jgi:hypothetical protein